MENDYEGILAVLRWLSCVYRRDWNMHLSYSARIVMYGVRVTCRDRRYVPRVRGGPLPVLEMPDGEEARAGAAASDFVLI